MALIKCSECNAEISDQASACPNCGCPVALINTASKGFSDNEGNNNLPNDNALNGSYVSNSHTEISGASVLQNNQPSVETNGEKKSSKIAQFIKKYRIIILAVILLIVCATSAIMIFTGIKKEADKKLEEEQKKEAKIKAEKKLIEEVKRKEEIAAREDTVYRAGGFEFVIPKEYESNGEGQFSANNDGINDIAIKSFTGAYTDDEILEKLYVFEYAQAELLDSMMLVLSMSDIETYRIDGKLACVMEGEGMLESTLIKARCVYINNPEDNMYVIIMICCDTTNLGKFRELCDVVDNAQIVSK